MPRTTVTVDLQDELERIDQELDDVADEVAELPDGAPHAGDLAERGVQLERQLAGLQWATDPPDDDPIDGPIEEVTLGGLNAGEYLDVQAETADEGGTVSKVIFAAKGVVDAPFIDDSMSEAERVQAVRDLPPQFHEWLATKVDDLSTPDLEGNGFAQRVSERMTE